MKSKGTVPGSRIGLNQFRRLGASVLTILLTIVCAGCPVADPNGGGDNGSLSASIAFFSNIRLSGEQNVTIVYSTTGSPTAISAFYVPVASTAIDAAATGSEVIFANNLSAGTNQTTSLNTLNIPIGLYRIGLNLTDTSGSIKVRSQGTFEITQLPTPVFELPNQDLQIVAGTPVDIRVDVGDDENAVQWRLFYVEANTSVEGVPANQIGDPIATGAASQIITVWNTTAIANGTYRIGISVTDTGQSIDSAVNNNETIPAPTFNAFSVSIVDEIPTRTPPTVVVNQPSTDIEILGSETTLIQFEVTRFAGATQFEKVTPFYDVDDIATNGNEVPIGQPFEPFPLETTNVVFAGNMIGLGKTVHIGVRAEDGIGEPVTAYASGTITRLDPDAAKLTVTQPTNALAQKPGSVINVSWQIDNLPTTANAVVDIFVRRIGADGKPINATLVDSDKSNDAPIPLTQNSASFAAPLPGKFRITVRVRFTDDSADDLVDDAPVEIQISTLPTIFWLGSLLDVNPQFKGAIFEGVQFEDNAGSSFGGGEDFDGDGRDEAFIVSRYGKPQFVNPSGVGAGEAYMLRGRTQRYSGRLNLNSVADSIAGFVFTGVEPDGDLAPTETDGIASIFVSGDADGDGNGEVVFGFPHVFSANPGVNMLLGGQTMTNENGPIENYCPLGSNNPQFTRGGVVIVSSRNTQLTTDEWDFANRRCPLDLVGQLFESNNGGLVAGSPFVGPEPGDGPLCTGNWMADRLSFIDSEGNCPDDTPPGVEPTFIGCSDVLGGDGEKETLIHPKFGFDVRLSDPYPCNFLYTNVNTPWPCSGSDDSGSLPAGCPTVDLADTNCDLIQFITPDLDLCSQTVDIFVAVEPGGDPLSPTCEAGKNEVRPRLSSLNEALLDTPITSFRSGFYQQRISGLATDENPNWNDIRRSPGNNEVSGTQSLVGCRIIGEQVNDGFGTSVAQSEDNLIISAPFSNDVNVQGGIAFSVNDFEAFGSGATLLPDLWQLPEDLGFDPRDYDDNRAPPQPHQFLANGNSHVGSGSRPGAIGPYSDVSGFDIYGDTDERIQNLVGIPDFNEDNRPDVAIGAPMADVDSNGTIDGAVYIVFSRADSLEDDVELSDLKRAVNDPERLSGVLIRETYDGGQRFGESIDGDFDFNHDGVADVVVGNPDGNGGTGEVVIIFGDRDLISPQNGIPVETDGSNTGLLDRREGARIRGVQIGSEFGFNIANIGDIDGDGANDLAIAAPNATPMFDGNPNDSVDVLDTPGLDRNLDGIRDDVTGPTGVRDFVVDKNDELAHAGLVYIILSSTNTANFPATLGGVMDISISALGSDVLDGSIIVGHRGDRYAYGGSQLHEGDFLGGGDAGEDSTVLVHGIQIKYGGNPSKAPAEFMGIGGEMLERPRGRARGLGRLGDIDGDGLDDFAIGAQLADPRVNSVTGEGTKNGGEAYVLYGFTP